MQCGGRVEHAHPGVARDVRRDQRGQERDVADPEAVGRPLGEREPGRDAAVGVRHRRLLLRDEVAQPERHPGAVHLVERLRHVRVVPVDDVDDRRAGDPVDDVVLVRVGGGRVLGAEVQSDQHNLGALTSGTGGVGDDPRRVDERHRPGPVGRHRDAVGAVRVVEQRHPHPGDGGDEGRATGSLRQRGAEVRHAHPVQGPEGPDHALGPGVEAVVGRGAARVVAGALQAAHHLGGAEKIGYAENGPADRPAGSRGGTPRGRPTRSRDAWRRTWGRSRAPAGHAGTRRPWLWPRSPRAGARRRMSPP